MKWRENSKNKKLNNCTKNIKENPREKYKGKSLSNQKQKF